MKLHWLEPWKGDVIWSKGRHSETELRGALKNLSLLKSPKALPKAFASRIQRAGQWLS